MTTDEPGVRTARPMSGRIDKRNAILVSAFSVFARLGYASACVKEIASEAGVAKPTVYNHMNDKATLFRESVEAAAERIGAPSVSAVRARLDSSVGDVETTLLGVGEDLSAAMRDSELWALRRLACAESSQFPELHHVVTAATEAPIRRALGDKIARWTLRGELRAQDPDVAAEQFLALVAGPLEFDFAQGTRIPADDRSSAVVRAAVTTFLRAFGPAPTDREPTGSS
ncbi:MULTISPECIES: TetR/AcrR family transcriptional regulator [unclassified Pseudonocardia]|uniref:TetR/AcrR family transcriptional regulator n=1 Tax=unclassified Pseudonocardia TaxID=2619320 RepID=UPI0002EA3C23|nr:MULTISPECIES: TetR/AcrR family transcriptional regulator [unclassified Pseudonocardia]